MPLYTKLSLNDEYVASLLHCILDPASLTDALLFRHDEAYLTLWTVFRSNAIHCAMNLVRSEPAETCDSEAPTRYTPARPVPIHSGSGAVESGFTADTPSAEEVLRLQTPRFASGESAPRLVAVAPVVTISL